MTNDMMDLRSLVEKTPGADILREMIGFFAVLHSWGQNLLFHPHVVTSNYRDYGGRSAGMRSRTT
jgi:hypothetical protein